MLLAVFFALQTATSTNPQALIDDALKAMGGLERLQALTSLRLEGVEISPLVGISTDRAHPVVLVNHFSELRDSKTGSGVRHSQLSLPIFNRPCGLECQ